jgi:hypothetical protein
MGIEVPILSRFAFDHREFDEGGGRDRSCLINGNEHEAEAGPGEVRPGGMMMDF